MSEKKFLKLNHPKRKQTTMKDSERLSKTRRPVHVKFCPKCGSYDVFWAQGLPQLWSLWQCHRCGYQGPVILEDGKLAEKIEEKWKKRKSPDVGV